VKNIPNVHEIYQAAINIPNGHLNYHHLRLKDLPKFTQIGIFGLKNIPSGNPAAELGLGKVFFLFFEKMVECQLKEAAALVPISW
jgi:hypothetical protein